MGLSDRLAKSKTLIGIAACGCAVLACNAIIGIDGFTESNDVPDSFVPSDGSAIDNFVPQPEGGPSDAGADVKEIILPPGSNPSTWATWPMPDSVGGPNPPAYVAGDGGIQDNVTGLVWMQQGITFTPAGGQPTVTDAQDACTKASTKTITWRVPTRIELVSLLDHVFSDGGVHTSPFIDTTYFSAQKTQYWTASPVLPPDQDPLVEPIQFWLVDFSTGTVTTNASIDTTSVRCVKAK